MDSTTVNQNKTSRPRPNPTDHITILTSAPHTTMAPVAVSPTPAAFVRPDDPSGRKFEATNDAIDAINVAKLLAADKAQADADNAYDASQFDKEHDKAAFRQFVDENESSKRFYTCVCGKGEG